MEFISSYPSWYILLCICLGLGFALLLYYKNTKLPDTSKLVRVVLFSLRAIAVSLIAFLLLNPFIKRKERIVEPPNLVIAIDDSYSMQLGVDTNKLKSEIAEIISQVSDLKDYKTNFLLFGQSLKNGFSPDFNQKSTNSSVLFTDIKEKYANQNLAAVLLISDGIFNQGENPIYAAQSLNAPIISIGTGDTTLYKDFGISFIQNNSIAYFGNEFPIRASIKADNLKNTNSKIQLFEVKTGSKKLLKTIDFSPNTEQWTKEIDFIALATENGILHFRLEINPASGEKNISNNYRDIFIEVIENKSNVLIVSESIHPDISAIKQALEKNKNLKVIYKSINEVSNIKEYDLIIAYQLPSLSNKATALFQSIPTDKKPVWHIVGAQSDLNQLNQIQSDFKMIKKGNNMNKSFPEYVNTQSSFTLAENASQVFNQYAPLDVPFGDIQITSTFNTILKQKIKGISTTYPLWGYSNTGSKTAVTFGEGLWQWRIGEFEKYTQTTLFDELINKQVQVLTLKEDKRPFRVKPLKNMYLNGEQTGFTAELYNQSFEFVKDAEIKIDIKGPNNKMYNYTFYEGENNYYINTGMFEGGQYTYQSSTKLNGNDFSVSGKFSIETTDPEQINTVANHKLLQQLANESAGTFIPIAEREKIKSTIESLSNSKSVSYEHESFEDLINLLWLLPVICSLLITEWFIRKYIGSY